MLGSASSISDANIALNTAVADELRRFADVLEASQNFESDLHELVKSSIRDHKRILFNGNGYDDAWIAEAERRGLQNYRTTPSALSHLLDEKNINLFTENKVFSEAELRSRCEVMLDNYCKVLGIEALTMIQMVRSAILPSATKYRRYLAETILSVNNADENADTTYENEQIKKLSSLTALTYKNVNALEKVLSTAKLSTDLAQSANIFRDRVIPSMNELRIVVDEMETIMAKEYWPYPTYGDLLFSVR